MKYLIAKGATKRDFDVRVTVWRAIQPDTITVLMDLGVDVPDEVVQYHEVERYRWLKESGISAEDAYSVAKSAGLNSVKCIRILREIYSLSLMRPSLSS
jgi:hypothetical protein